MTEEPTYIYHKGEGWVPFQVEDTFACHYVDIAGDIWEVHERKPNKGERWSVMWEGEFIMDALNWFTQNCQRIDGFGKWDDSMNVTERFITFLPTK